MGFGKMGKFRQPENEAFQDGRFTGFDLVFEMMGKSELHQVHHGVVGAVLGVLV